MISVSLHHDYLYGRKLGDTSFLKCHTIVYNYKLFQLIYSCVTYQIKDDITIEYNYDISLSYNIKFLRNYGL